MKIATSLSLYPSYTKHMARLCYFCLAVLIPLTACSQMKTIQWREEVKLANGQIIVVDRQQEYRLVNAGGGGNGWLLQSERIKAMLPSLNKEIAWGGEGVTPLAIDMANSGDIYLVATITTLQGRSKYSISHGDHVAFKYSSNGPWVQIPVESVPHEIQPNLLVDSQTLFIENKHSTKEVVSLALKEKVDSDPRIDKSYRHWPTK